MHQLIAVLFGSLTIGMGQLAAWVEAPTRFTQNTAVQVMPAEGRLSSDFGFRHHPIHKGKCLHTGIDIANERGTLISATGAGRVLRVERDRGYGLLVEIDHGQGWTTRYAHLSASDVKVGDVVGVGAMVGKMGATGSATGNHLHFELRRYSLAVNPTPYLNAVTPSFAQN